MPPKYLRYFRARFEDALGRKYVAARLYPVGYIFDLFELEFGKSPSKGVSCLQLWYTEEHECHLTKQGAVFDGIFDVYYYLDFAAVRAYDLMAHKRFFLDSILECLDAYADEYGWDREYCHRVHQKIVEAGIVFDRFWGKQVRHRKTGWRVQAHVACFENLDLSLVVWDKTGAVVQKKFLAKLAGTTAALQDAYGRLVWEDERRIRLYRSNGRDYWEYDVQTGEARFGFPRAESGDAQGQYHLGRMYLEGTLVPEDRERALYWLRRSAAQGYKHAINLLKRLEQDDSNKRGDS